MTGTNSAPSTQTFGARTALAASVIVLVSADLLLKGWAAGGLTAGRSVDLKLIQLKVTFNSGMAFGFGSGLPTSLLLGAGTVITLAVAAVAWRSCDQVTAVERVGMATVIAGAIGNLVDRAADGVVTDYLHTGWFPTFNFADVLITLGVGILLLCSLRADQETPSKPELLR